MGCVRQRSTCALLAFVRLLLGPPLLWRTLQGRRVEEGQCSVRKMNPYAHAGHAGKLVLVGRDFRGVYCGVGLHVLSEFQIISRHVTSR